MSQTTASVGVLRIWTASMRTIRFTWMTPFFCFAWLSGLRAYRLTDIRIAAVPATESQDTWQLR